ncbi:MAG: hypothetical protein H6Q68_3067 [Firmicutes bacterium]|nr:hypothetical protein [Bacillota bacterium]
MDRKLNIVLVSNLYSPNVIGGAEILVSFLAETLAAQQHKVTVISTMGPSKETIHRSCINGVDIIRFFPKNLYWLYQKENPNIIKRAAWHVVDAWNYSTVKPFRQLLMSIKPDIIHTHNIDGFSPVIWSESKKLGLPVIHTAHDYHYLCPRSTLLKRSSEICTNPSIICQIYRKWYASQMANIDCFSSPSQFLLDIYKQSGVDFKRSTIVRNGVIAEKIVDAVVDCSQEKNRINLLYLGQLSEHKGVSTLLRAFERISPTQRYILNIAGKGPLEDEINEIAKTNPYIKYHGFISGEKKKELIKCSDALVIPSEWYENAPISVLEAYHHGVPVISSNIGGLPELVQHNENGLLFEMGQADSFASQLMRMADPALVKQLKIGALKSGQHYTAKQMTEDYLRLYSELI